MKVQPVPFLDYGEIAVQTKLSKHAVCVQHDESHDIHDFSVE